MIIGNIWGYVLMSWFDNKEVRKLENCLFKIKS